MNYKLLKKDFMDIYCGKIKIKLTPKEKRLAKKLELELTKKIMTGGIPNPIPYGNLAKNFMKAVAYSPLHAASSAFNRVSEKISNMTNPLLKKMKDVNDKIKKKEEQFIIKRNELVSKGCIYYDDTSERITLIKNDDTCRVLEWFSKYIIVYLMSELTSRILESKKPNKNVEIQSTIITTILSHYYPKIYLYRQNDTSFVMYPENDEKIIYQLLNTIDNNIHDKWYAYLTNCADKYEKNPELLLDPKILELKILDYTLTPLPLTPRTKH